MNQRHPKGKARPPGKSRFPFLSFLEQHEKKNKKENTFAIWFCLQPAAKMIPLPRFRTQCGEGFGIAACPLLKLLVTPSENKLMVFALPESVVAKPTRAIGGLDLVRVMGGVEPLLFEFDYDGFSGLMAFTGSTASTRFLVVTYAGHEAVHVVDVVLGKHVGYVACPGSVKEPKGVAARDGKVAVCVSNYSWSQVHLYEGSGDTWLAIRKLPFGLHTGMCHGLQFTDDETALVVASSERRWGCLYKFRVADGTLVQTTLSGEGLSALLDVQECEGGVWASTHWSVHFVELFGGPSGPARLGKSGGGDGEFIYPTALAFVPGLGLVVREVGNGGRLQFFATPDVIAMASMSPTRVMWMKTVVCASRFQ
jgi:hypothetical protein